MGLFYFWYQQFHCCHVRCFLPTRVKSILLLHNCTRQSLCSILTGLCCCLLCSNIFVFSSLPFSPISWVDNPTATKDFLINNIYDLHRNNLKSFLNHPDWGSIKHTVLIQFTEHVTPLIVRSLTHMHKNTHHTTTPSAQIIARKIDRKIKSMIN